MVLQPGFKRTATPIAGVRSLFFILLILLLSPALIRADGAGGAINRSIALVFDLSYSMLSVDPDTGESRYALGVRAVEKLAEGAGGDEEWVCILADDAGTVTATGGYTTDHQAVVARLKNGEPWGTTSLEEMVRAGLDQAGRAAEGTRRYVVLVTDGINTHGPLYAFPAIEHPGDGVTPVVLGFSIGGYKGFPQKVSDWAEASGGLFLFHDEVDRLRRVLDGEGSSQADGGLETPADTKTAAAGPGVPEKAPLFLPIWWIFLIPLAGTSVFTVRQFLKWSAARKAVRNRVIEGRETVTLSYSTHGGQTERRTFEHFPVKVAGSGKADLLLEKPRISSGARSFSIIREGGGVKFSANGDFVINGVGRRHLILTGGERINFGRYRLTFEGAAYLPPPPLPLPAPRFLLFIAPIAVFIMLAVFFRAPVVIGRRRVSAAIESPLPPRLDAEAPNNPGAGAKTGDGDAPARTASVGLKPAQAQINTFPTVMWEPGAALEFFKVDALFFHAHPDDETLDFGILLRRLADAGKRTAVVIFTDGGSGIDQYPRRIVGGTYPARDLRGGDLGEVRAEEARSAMSILGVGHYVRLGLENSPYGGVMDVKSTGTTKAVWGGESVIVDRLASLIVGYRPEIIVSPDGPGEALEHFEHETVGLLVEAALEKLKDGGEYIPAGRLVSVDPLQKALYSGAVGIYAAGIDTKCGLSYRAVQAAALAAHHTQRDSSVVGVENLSGFENEYYKIVSWELAVSIESYLSPF